MTDGPVVIHEIRQVIDHIDHTVDPASEPLGDRDSAFLLHTAGQRHDAITAWRWVIGDNSVHLFADPDRQLPITDPDSRDLFVSCGAALHHARVAFAAVGWATTVHRLPNPAQPDHLAALECFPRAATAGDIALAAAICPTRGNRDHPGCSSRPGA